MVINNIEDTFPMIVNPANEPVYLEPTSYKKEAEEAIAKLSDGDALNLDNTYGKLLRILVQHVGERGDSEGAVETLERIIKERSNYRAFMEKVAASMVQPVR